MLNLKNDCKMVVLSDDDVISDFDCGDADLNDFFNRDALNYERQMLSQTCFFRLNSNDAIVCAFSFSASSITSRPPIFFMRSPPFPPFDKKC